MVLDATGRAATGACPACGTPSTRIHDRYQRHPLDLPWRGVTVRLLLTARRFCCDQAECDQATFAADFAPLVPRYARRTAEITALLLEFALTSGGEAGARLAQAVGVPTSPDTLLRVVRQTPPPDPTPVRILGIDDLALRRGQTYATIFIDLETHRPVDLLPGRTAAVVADWLRTHPGVEVVSRDRAEAYAEGARSGAPEAIQVADRFHLVHNASAALIEVLQRYRRRLDLPAPDFPAPDHQPPVASAVSDQGYPLSPAKQRQADARSRRVARWERVRTLHAAGVSGRRIAEEVGVNRKTVQRLIAAGDPPHNQRERPRPGGLTSPTLQPFVEYLQDRWQQGCTNASRLFREIQAQGYGGSQTLLIQAVQAWRPPRPTHPVRRTLRRVGVRGLCLRLPESLSPEEQVVLQQFLTDEPEVGTGYELLQRFRAVVHDRNLGRLETWLSDAQASNLASFAGLAHGIIADRAAVEAALTTPWSNGMVEGHVHRVKLLKRQGYGRANLDLLRCRVLAS